MNLTRWKPKEHDPFQELLQLSNELMNFSPFPANDRGSMRGWLPAMDVTEDANSITVKADLPGLKKEDISLSLNNNFLTIKGERKEESEKKEKNYHRVERSYGVFERSVDLGVNVDGTKVQANYKDGVLEIIIPKAESSKPKQIEIK